MYVISHEGRALAEASHLKFTNLSVFLRKIKAINASKHYEVYQATEKNKLASLH